MGRISCGRAAKDEGDVRGQSRYRGEGPGVKLRACADSRRPA